VTEKKNSYKQNLIKNMIEYILNEMYYILESEKIKLETRLNRSISNPLTQQQMSDVQMISVIVARGGLNYINKDINGNDILTEQNTIDNQVTKTELGILTSANRSGRVQANLDSTLRASFRTYATSEYPYISLGSKETILEKINEIGSNYQIINNASNRDALEAIFGPRYNSKIICPISSIIDAMGTTGSCYNRQHQETGNMNFFIQNADQSKYYQGQTIVKQGREVKVIFSALFNDFYLPNVEINIDIRRSPVVTLSANNTFKNVINKILTIWARIFSGQYVNNAGQIMWETLESKSIYSELVSCGAIKCIGDLFQEVNSTVEYGGYDSDVIKNNNIYRIGAMGDQPSGVRAGYILLKASSGYYPKSISGFISPGDNSIMIVKDENNSKKMKTSYGGKKKTTRKHSKRKRRITVKKQRKQRKRKTTKKQRKNKKHRKTRK
jgi:hypothetical protein